MKVVINKCYGGFSLSPLAIKRLAELKGKACYFFVRDAFNAEYVPCPDVPKSDSFLWSAYTVPNPYEVAGSQSDWHSMTQEQKAASNAAWSAITLETRQDNRADQNLVKVVEELGSDANGRCADLKVVEIPDGVEWQVEEYDGLEHIAQKHETWG